MRSKSYVRASVASACVLSLLACDGAACLAVVHDAEDCGDVQGTGAQRFDAEASCLEEPVILCAQSGLTEQHGCAIHVDSGDLYLTSYPIVFSETREWVECSSEEASAVFGAHSCSE